VPSAKEPARIPEIPAGKTVRINSAKTTRVVRVNPKTINATNVKQLSQLKKLKNQVKPAKKK